jgi:hypothetical protein
MILTYVLLTAARHAGNPGGIILTGFLFLVVLSVVRFFGLVTNQQLGVSLLVLFLAVGGVFALVLKRHGESET